MSATTIPLKYVSAKTTPSAPAVYCIKCLPTGRVYIGSSKILYHRILYSRSCLRRGERLPQSMILDYNEYGINSFIISWCEMEEKFISSVEKIAIELNHEKAYNIYSNVRKKRTSSRNSNAWQKAGEIQFLRYQKNLTLTEVADQVGCSYSTVRRILEATSK